MGTQITTNQYRDNTKNFLLKPVRPIDLGTLKRDDKRDKSRIQTRGFVIMFENLW